MCENLAQNGHCRCCADAECEDLTAQSDDLGQMFRSSTRSGNDLCTGAGHRWFGVTVSGRLARGCGGSALSRGFDATRPQSKGSARCPPMSAGSTDRNPADELTECE